MDTREQIKAYIATQPEPKRRDLQALHRIILELMPDCNLWFLDGKDEQGQTVSNPNIGYGLRTIKYADGKTSSSATTTIYRCCDSIGGWAADSIGHFEKREP